MHIPPLSSHTHFPYLYFYHLHIPRIIYAVKFCCSFHGYCYLSCEDRIDFLFFKTYRFWCILTYTYRHHLLRPTSGHCLAHVNTVLYVCVVSVIYNTSVLINHFWTVEGFACTTTPSSAVILFGHYCYCLAVYRNTGTPSVYLHNHFHTATTNSWQIGTNHTPLVTVDPTSAKAPILTQGDISPVVMMDFENAALNFFVSKSVPVEKQVTMVIPGIKDLCIHNWVTPKHACIVVLPFADFMAEVHVNYLPTNWEDQVCNEILTSSLTSSGTSFWNWSQQLLKLNCLLCRTLSVFDEPTLHNHLEAHLNDELKAKVTHSKAPKGVQRQGIQVLGCSYSPAQWSAHSQD